MPASLIRSIACSLLMLALTGAAQAQERKPLFTFASPDTLPAATAAPGPSHVAADTNGGAALANGSGDWKFDVYPVLLWIPTNMSFEVDGPFDLSGGSGGSGGGGGTGQVGGKIVDTRFDGAFLAGFTASNDTWRFDFDGVYAAVGGDRVTPNLTVDVDLIYGHGSVAREIGGDVFVTAGVRRFAIKYEINFLDFDTFENKPGIWDPLVGVAYHKVGRTLEFHAHVDYGGFGVGADSDLGLGALIDWKPFGHFGFTAGYNLIKFKFKRDVGPYEFTAKQTIGGPVVGIGLYF
jgi:hypothetical protein